MVTNRGPHALQESSCLYLDTPHHCVSASAWRLPKLVDYKPRDGFLLWEPRRNIWIKVGLKPLDLISSGRKINDSSEREGQRGQEGAPCLR